MESERELVEAALALGARDVLGWSRAEIDYVQMVGAKRRPATAVTDLKEGIRRGGDPLGDAYTTLLSPEERRPHGATYTPQSIVVMTSSDGLPAGGVMAVAAVAGVEWRSSLYRLLGGGSGWLSRIRRAATPCKAHTGCELPC